MCVSVGARRLTIAPPQYLCRNTLNDQLLENVSVAMVGEADELTPERVVPIPQLKYDDVQSCYNVYRKAVGAYPPGALPCSCISLSLPLAPSVHAHAHAWAMM
jgi:hypothetical protein